MRFAVYYTPSPTSVLHDLGSKWLGYDAYSGQNLEQPGHGALKGMTDQASRYGFHATLKAPFHLKPGMTLEDLMACMTATAQKVSAVAISRLVLKSIDGFLALVPETQGEDVEELAATCVRALDHLRAPPDDIELGRRNLAALSSRQKDYLMDWGYPYVFNEFRFHMTLTQKIAEHDMPELLELAQNHFHQVVNQPLSISALTIFRESNPGAYFRVAHSFPLAANIRAAYA